MGRPPLSRLRRRFAPLRGTQRRCAALRAAPPGRYAPRALRAQPFCKHEKNATFCTAPFARLDCVVTKSSFPTFTSCRTTGRLASVAASTSRTAASAAAASFTACGPRLKSTGSVPGAPATNIPAPCLRPVLHSRRALCASGALPWRRPASAAALVAASASTAALPALSARWGSKQSERKTLSQEHAL